MLPTTGKYFLVICKFSATRNVNFELFTPNFGGLQYQVASGSISIPADSPEAFAVGATFWQDDSPESYSSWGPTTDGRNKPDISAPDCTSTSGVSQFCGTSGSAPHVVGAAALNKQKDPALTAAELRSLLKAQSLDLGPEGNDNQFGAGRLHLRSADLSVEKTVDQASPVEGEIVTYNITLNNGGPDTATNVAVTDLLPDGVSFVSHTVTQGTFSAGTGIWSAGSLANNAGATLIINATVDSGTGGASIINIAELTATDQADPNSTPNNHDTGEDDQDSAILTPLAPPRLTVFKVVTNDDGGTKTGADFTLFVDADPVISEVENPFSAGIHTVSETEGPGYAATITGDCAVDGSITLNPGDVKSCTITNDDIAPLLTVFKVVTNDDGGTKTGADFPLFLDAVPVISGDQNSFSAGIHTLSETGDPGYAATITGDCAVDGSITLNPGDVKSCTITNDDIAEDDLPHLSGRMTGGGSIQHSNDRVTHGFQLDCQLESGPNKLEVNWARGNRFHLENLALALCQINADIDEGQPVAGFNTFEGSGMGLLNGAPGASIEFLFTDAGEPGIDDWAEIVIRDSSSNVILNISGYLAKGNHQTHRKRGK